jgi:transposase-like protein
MPATRIRHAVWLDLRFTLNFRDVEDLFAGRGLDISYCSTTGDEVRTSIRQGTAQSKIKADLARAF